MTVEAGSRAIDALKIYLPDNESHRTVCKSTSVDSAFIEKVRMRLKPAPDSTTSCPIKSGNVQIPFALNIQERTPSSSVSRGARRLGADFKSMDCQIMHMRESLFMSYLDVYNSIPEIVMAYTKPYRPTYTGDNTWKPENKEDGEYTMREFTESSKIIPNGHDVARLAAAARALVLGRQDTMHDGDPASVRENDNAD